MARWSAPGDHSSSLHITCPGEDLWDLALVVDGSRSRQGTGFRLLMAIAPFEGIDIGMDRRSPVCWSVYERHGPFPFSGTLRSVRYQPGAPAPDSPTQFMDMLRDWGPEHGVSDSIRLASAMTERGIGDTLGMSPRSSQVRPPVRDHSACHTTVTDPNHSSRRPATPVTVR